MLNETVLDLEFSTMSKQELVAAVEELRRCVYDLKQQISVASSQSFLSANETSSTVRFLGASAQGTIKADAFLDRPQR